MSRNWQYSLDHRQPCQVLEIEEVWGRRFARIWLPMQDVVVRVAEDRIGNQPESAQSVSADRLIYISTAAKLADSLNQNILLAPATSRVIPLPHQLRALKTAVASDSVRYLLADEVGLGKTVEAGLIMRELKLRGLARRVLVVAPKGLCQQWVSEMEVHFGESFQLVLPEDLKAMRQFHSAGNLTREPNAWRAFDQVVCPLDSVKPLEKRKGWNAERVEEYNRLRFDDLVCAGWDLVVVDEAHRLGGASDQVARYKLGRGIAEASPYLLLLSATPHQGKSDGFRRLVSLLDADSFLDDASISRETVSPFVIRTEKRHAITADAEPLFQPRQTRLVPVEWLDRHKGQSTLYQAVTEYVRVGYNQAMREKKTHLGFLLVLMQRLVTSSTRAIRVSLERRLECLKGPDEQLSFFPSFDEEEWGDLDGQAQLDTLLTTKFKALKNEQAEVSLLLDAAKRVEATGPDAKAEALLDTIYVLQQEDVDPDLKVLIFTEFVPTQEMLAEFFEARGFSVERLNGTMDMEERRRVQAAFRSKAHVLISTDAGGEGLNLQFCHVVVNYDIPWNPMRLEQRIGRVDRIGQTHPVKALNFVLSGTVEYRVREVLETKLAVILEEFGIDKTSDVLDSADAEKMFDRLYVDALVEPDNLDARVREVAGELTSRADDADTARHILGGDQEFDREAIAELQGRSLEPWIHRMTSAYLRANAGEWHESSAAIRCRWPDGTEETFSAATDKPLDLQHPRVRELVTRIPQQLQDEPARVHVPDLPSAVDGMWSLWQVQLVASTWKRHRIVPIFLTKDGRSLGPTAQRVWDAVIDGDFTASRTEVPVDFSQLRAIAMPCAKPAFDELCAEHRTHLAKETERTGRAFAARRRIIDRVGLGAVRSHRLHALAEEEAAWSDELARSREPIPEFNLLLALQVKGGAND